MTTIGPEPSVDTEAIREAVRRDTARRRRLFVLYLLLLLLPIGIGIYAITRAPSEVETVARKSVPYVVEPVREQLKPTIAETARPVVQAELRAQYDATIAPQIRTMAATTSELQTAVSDLRPVLDRSAGQVSELASVVRSNDAIIQRARPQLEMLPRLDDRLATLERRVSEAERLARSNDARLAELAASMRQLQRSLQDLSERCCTTPAAPTERRRPDVRPPGR
jgi:ABC-type transporter Mla subunit MlaD